MNYQVRIFYLDGKDLSVMLRKSDVNRFLACVKNNEAFWDEKQEGAFYSPSSQIRYVQAEEKPLEREPIEEIQSDIDAPGCKKSECEANPDSQG